MPAVMNDFYRARLLEFQTQKVLDSTQPLNYFIGALDSVELARALTKLCRPGSSDRDDRESDRPGQRFINMVHRDDDVACWIAFLRHEQKREASQWKRDDLKSLPNKLKEWSTSLGTGGERDEVVRKVQEALENRVEDLTHEKCVEERRRIGLRAFRAMLWKLRAGGEEE